MSARVVITGANSAIGRAVVSRALERSGLEVVAAVRSQRAADQVPDLPDARGDKVLVDYANVDSLRRAFSGAAAVVHLPGLLFETAASPYELANIETTRAALEAASAEGIQKFVLLSACGANATSSNRFFRTKGEAEALVHRSELDHTVLRCPLVLGCDSNGDRALAHQARSRWLPLLAGGHYLEQPVDARDVADGLLNAACDGKASKQTLDLVGPETASMRDIIGRAARILGTRIRIIPIPLALMKAAAGLRERLRGPGGMTRDVLEVLTGHLAHDPEPAARALEIELTPLDALLTHSLETTEAT